MENYYSPDEWYRPYLSPGEYVRWAGQPEPRLGFHPFYLFAIPFFIVWFGAVASGTFGLFRDYLETGENFFGLLFMIPFWLGGIFFVSMIFIVPRHQLKNTKYVITTQKAMAYYRGRITVINLDPLPYVYLSAIDKHGCGSITIGGVNNASSFGIQPNTYQESQIGITLTNIKEPAKVYELIVHKDI